jgi:disulfide oxidoreductase YuzD
MKSIGIATLHQDHNYGSILQALSLQITLEKLGHKPEFIDYYMFFAGLNQHSLYPDSTKLKVEEAYKSLVDARLNSFNCFIEKNLNLSKKRYYNLSELIQENFDYDVFMSGGDVIWYTKTFNTEWELFLFLAFTKSENKIAFGTGVSWALHDIVFPFENLRLIETFKAISIREELAAKSLQLYSDKKIEWVLDCSLLSVAKDFSKYMIDPKYPNEKYIFAYFTALCDNEELKDFLNRISKKYALPVVLVHNFYPIETGNITTYDAIGPGQWLWLMSHSQFVLTNGFHGTCFSILFNKPFLVNRRDGRINTVLEKLELTDLCIDGYADGLVRDVDFSYDFTNANALLEKERERCLNILERDINLCN